MGFFSGLFGKKGSKKGEEAAPKTAPKKPVAPNQGEGEVSLLGFGLLSTQEFPMEELELTIQKTFQLEQTSTNSKEGRTQGFQLKLGELTVWCVHMDKPVPNGEVAKSIQYNLVPQEDQEPLANHRSFLAISCKGKEADRIEAAKLLSKLLELLMGMEQAVGVYMGGASLLISKKVYLQRMQDSIKGFSPLLWIGVHFYKEKDTMVACTRGMDQFGKLDLALYGVKLEPADSYQLLYKLAATQMLGLSDYQDKNLLQLPAEYGNLELVCAQRDGLLYLIG